MDNLIIYHFVNILFFITFAVIYLVCYYYENKGWICRRKVNSSP